MAPKNKSFLTAEITYSTGDKFSRLKPELIMKKVKTQIEKTGIIDNKYLLGTSINFEPFVYPVQFSDYKSEVARVKSFVESFDNLFLLALEENLITLTVRFYFTSHLI